MSDGFTYTYTQDPSNPRVGAVVSMAYQGRAIADTDTFTVVTNSFLANGGDGFPTFAAGTDRTDTGQIDLDATLSYFEAIPVVDPAPLGVRSSRRMPLRSRVSPAPSRRRFPPRTSPAARGRAPRQRPRQHGCRGAVGPRPGGRFLVVAGGLAFALRKRRTV